jgi:ABC-type lipoprotein release transport system permease subunit
VGPDVSINPAVAAATATLLIALVLMAAWLPARRAALIEPTLALRAE